MVLGAGVGGAGACPPAGEDWYAGVGIEGALGSLAMLCCKSLFKDSVRIYKMEKIKHIECFLIFLFYIYQKENGPQAIWHFRIHDTFTLDWNINLPSSYFLIKWSYILLYFC